MHINLKKFKKVAQDEHHSTMEDKDGHQFKIAHKPLSPEMRKQVMAIPMADGGEVADKGPAINQESARAFEAGVMGRKISKPEPKRDEYSASSSKVIKYKSATTPDDPKEEKYKESVRAFNAKMNQPLAKGGEVEEEVSSRKPEPIKDTPDQIALDAANVAPENKYNKVYQDRVDFYKQNQPGLPGQSVEGDALAEAERIKNIDEFKANQENSAAKESATQAADIEARKVALGILPQPTAQGPMPASVTPEAPAASAPAPQAAPQIAQPTGAVGDSLIKDLNKQSKEEAHIAQQSVADQQNLMLQAKQNFDTSNKEFQDLMKATQDQKIDPQRYWNNKSTLGKVSTVIGLLLGGFSFSDKPNAAIESLNKSIDNDIDAQKAELGKKQNLLSANLAHYKNLDEAVNMTQAMQMNLVSQKMKEAAAKAGNPVIKAQLLENAAKYDNMIAEKGQKQAIQKAIGPLVQEAQKDPKKAPGVINALLQAGATKQAEELQSRLVPGIGFTNTPKDKDAAVEVQSRKTEMLTNIDKLQSMIEGKGTYELFGSHNADLDRLLDNLATDHAKLADPSSIARPSEVDQAKRSLPKAGSLTEKNSTALSMLKKFREETEHRANTRLKLYGLPVVSDKPVIPNKKR